MGELEFVLVAVVAVEEVVQGIKKVLAGGEYLDGLDESFHFKDYVLVGHAF